MRKPEQQYLKYFLLASSLTILSSCSTTKKTETAEVIDVTADALAQPVGEVHASTTVGNAYTASQLLREPGYDQQQEKNAAMLDVYNTRNQQQMRDNLYNEASGSRFIKSVQATPRGQVWTLPQDSFDDDTHALSISGAGHSIALARWLEQNPSRNVLLEGYTSIAGHPYQDRERSRHRAEALRDALLQLGIPAHRIATKAYGQDYPVAHNDTAMGRASNERVEVVTSRPGGSIPISREAAGVRAITGQASGSLMASRIRSTGYASSLVQVPPLLLD